MAEVLAREPVYEGYSTIERVTVRLEDGAEIHREVESHGHAVAVLPYDPEAKTALLVRQFRAPVKLHGGADTLLEAVAGMIDGGDTPEESIRREAMEEVGLRLGALERVATILPSPGVSTETMVLYLAAFAPDDRVAAGGGLAEDNEGIEVVTAPLRDLLDLGHGEVPADMKLLVLVQALRLRRPDLFA